MNYHLPFELGFYGWIGFIAFHIWFNWYLIVKRKVSPSYWGNFLYRVFAAAICLFIMHPQFDPLGDLYSWWGVPKIIGYEVGSFYLLFDPFLNWSRDLVIHYRGKKSGWIDPKLKLWHWWALKAGALVILILSLILIIYADRS